MRNAKSKWVDRMGRSLAPGRSRTAQHATVRARSKYTKPLPLELACHAPKAKRTYKERHPVWQCHPMYEARGLESLIGDLDPTRVRKPVPFRLVHKTDGWLGWTGDERLMRSICRLGGGDIYVC